MGANPHANGGVVVERSDHARLSRLRGGRFTSRAPSSPKPRGIGWIFARCDEAECSTPKNFRVFGPDETASNRLDALYEVTDKVWMEPIIADDENLSKDGRVMEVLSEHMCQGWLEGYLLTGRHGFFSCYEAFIHIIDSMFNQHAKWLKVTRDIPWRRPIASLNYLADLARLAAGPQRIQPSGSRLHRSCDEQEGRRRPRLSCRRTPIACFRSRTTACAAATM